MTLISGVKSLFYQNFFHQNIGESLVNIKIYFELSVIELGKEANTRLGLCYLAMLEGGNNA